MPEKEQEKTSKNCPKSEDGKHHWVIKLDSPGHHGEKKLVEIFECKLCGLKKPVQAK